MAVPGYEPRLKNSTASGVPSNLCGSSAINLKYNCSSYSSLPLSDRSEEKKEKKKNTLEFPLKRKMRKKNFFLLVERVRLLKKRDD